ncbi:MAG: HlyD family secretion protein [Planctomycetota bacterium]|jgi:multidrug resistance efflux pump
MTLKIPKLGTRLLVTGAVVLAAVVAVWVLWQRYVERPWTRMGQVQANVLRIAPRVSGVVTRVAVADNQQVKKGDLLFEIDPSAYRLQVTTARVTLEQARQDIAKLEAVVLVREASVKEALAAVESAKGRIEAATAKVTASKSKIDGATAGVDVAKSQVDAAKAALLGYKQQYDRAERLAKKGAGPVALAQALEASVAAGKASVKAAEASVPQANAALAQAKAAFVEAEANEVVARTGLGESEARLARARADVQQARADLGAPGDENVRIHSAQAGIATAELNLAWTRIEAPGDGYVTNVRVFQGMFASPGVQMLAFVDSSSFWVAGYFRETQVSTIKPGEKATITLMGYPDAVVVGEVESIGWAINPPGFATIDGPSGVVPQVQPMFDWIRLAQRVPVRVKLTTVPDGVRLVAGTTASVAID